MRQFFRQKLVAALGGISPVQPKSGPKPSSRQTKKTERRAQRPSGVFFDHQARLRHWPRMASRIMRQGRRKPGTSSPPSTKQTDVVVGHRAALVRHRARRHLRPAELGDRARGRQYDRQKNKVFIGSGAGTALSPRNVHRRIPWHWTYDTYAYGRGLGKAVVAQGGKKWFFLTADYAFGHDLRTGDGRRQGIFGRRSARRRAPAARHRRLRLVLLQAGGLGRRYRRLGQRATTPSPPSSRRAVLLTQSISWSG